MTNKNEYVYKELILLAIIVVLLSICLSGCSSRDKGVPLNVGTIFPPLDPPNKCHLDWVFKDHSKAVPDCVIEDLIAHKRAALYMKELQN